ncbi:hypothetical protein [Aeoliella sp. SH292]|uniref:hypothetical protein n=1 Tax=Aeoliella sp. SH292 TaxID=3454464 RepID=UPI003F9E7509
MDEESETDGLEKLLDLLLAHEVEFIVVGGQAEVLLGGSRTTFDVDLCYRRTAENLHRLAEAMKALQPTLRDAPAGLPFVLDAKTLALGSNFTFNTRYVPLDLLGWLDPIGAYEELVPSAESFEYKGRKLSVIGLEDLIRIKEYLGRPKDQEALLQLRAIHRLRQQKTAGEQEGTAEA